LVTASAVSRLAQAITKAGQLHCVSVEHFRGTPPGKVFIQVIIRRMAETIYSFDRILSHDSKY
jgi:hypothetical protein